MWESEETVPAWEPTFYDNKIYVANYCLSVEEGKLLWKGENQVSLAPPEATTCCVYDGKVYFSDRRYTRCLDAGTGELVWERKIKECSPVVAFGKVFLGKTCLDHNNGNKVWSSKLKFGGNVAISDKKVIVSGNKGTGCLDINSGEVLWESDIKGCLPVIVGEHVWTACAGKLSCLLLADGELIAQYDYESEGNRWYSQITVAKERLFVSTCWQGRLYCFEVYDKLIP